MSTEDEAYRQGKAFMADHVLSMIDEGGTPTQVVARISGSLTSFKQTREGLLAAVAELKAKLDADTRIQTVSVSPDTFTGDFIH